MSCCLAFVCQQGELEIKSLLLAASLRHHLGQDVELVAALPQPESHWGKPSTPTLAMLMRLGVRVVPVENPIGTDYPIGNKLACLSIGTSASISIFLDSDILCCSVTDFIAIRSGCLNAKPADFVTFGQDEFQWRAAYDICGVDYPIERVQATMSGVTMWPYFNAGVVALDRAFDFGAAWTDCARRIDLDPGVHDKRPWLDQIALPIAAKKLGLDFNCLDESLNYPAHVKPLDPMSPPILSHYHSPDVIRREPLLNALVCKLADQHPELRELMLKHSEWRRLLQPYAVKKQPSMWSRLIGKKAGGAMPDDAVRSAPDFLITGIPRSGTSYLCSLLNRQADTVVINEPEEVFTALASVGEPWGIPLMYRELRSSIRDGQQILNKLKNGEFIEDTAQIDVREDYLPIVTRPDFLLGTKNTLGYLARLPQLRRVMPHAVVVACVRHPFATISSWKSTFTHLAEADMSAQVVGHAGDAQLADVQRTRLAEIAATKHLPLRRALLWRHLAKILLEQDMSPIILRYEETVTYPKDVLRRILAVLPGAPLLRTTKPLRASLPRSRNNALEAEDIAAIRAICADVASQLGYDLASD